MVVVGGLGEMQLGNENECRAYPFADDAPMESSSGTPLPPWIVVDAFMCVRDGVESVENVSLSGVHVGPGMVSATFSHGGAPVAVCSVSKGSFEPYAPVPVRGGPLSGMCAFGDVFANLSSSGMPSITLSFPGGIPLAGSAVAHLPAPGVMKFVDDASGGEVSGNVVFDLSDGVGASVDDSKDGVSRVSLSLSDGLASRLTHPCHTPFDQVAYVNSRRPIRSINGMPVGRSGMFSIVFTTKDKIDGMK